MNDPVGSPPAEINEKIPGDFEFEIDTWWDDDDGLTRWNVQLPHQCDAWKITEGWMGASHEEAVARLEKFLAEGQAALARLRALRP